MAGGQILQIGEQSSGERCECELQLLFLQALRQLAERGGRLIIYGCSEQVLRIFTVAGLTDAGIVFDSRGAAMAELAVVE